VDYVFEVQQNVRFEVYDYDTGGSEFIGSVDSTIGAIVGAPNQTLVLSIKGKNGAETGKVLLRAEEVAGNSDKIYIELGARNVEDVEFWGKSDPFISIFRGREDGSYVKVHTTEYLPNNLNPIWRGFTLPVQLLCNGDFFRPIKIEICEVKADDYEKNGKHKFIGVLELNLNDLLLHDSRTFAFINPKKVSKKKYRDSGQLYVRNIYLVKEFSFLQYIQGNCKINLMVAIDFTASNGVPSNPASLHHLNPSAMNEYEKAIWAVGEILMNYDSTKTVPVWGFGGSPVPGAPTSHCFP
jgi:hypothetical protein